MVLWYQFNRQVIEKCVLIHSYSEKYIFLGLIHVNSYLWMIIFIVLGGVSIGSLTSCQDLPLYDVLGSEMVRSIHKGFSTIIGLCILGFYFIHGKFS